MNITESESNLHNLESLSIQELLAAINEQDKTVPFAVEKAIPQIEKLVEVVVNCLEQGGRLFYIGAGTSGRLGIVDASECPPTYGIPHEVVVGLIAGGDAAIRKAVEFAEDDTEQAWKDLNQFNCNSKDVLIGIAASGATPYVLGGLKAANERQITTGCIVCNPGSPIAREARFPVEVVVGPEVITGSTRMKAGTAQKLVLNMITTSAMVKMGRVAGNKMVFMQLSNQKLVQRGTRMLMEALHLEASEAKTLLLKYGSVQAALKSYNQDLHA